MRNVIFILAASLTIARPVLGGSITGTVRGSDGSVFAGFVTAYLPPGTAALPPRSRTVSAVVLPDGSFQLNSLGTGQHTLCAAAPSTIWLSSCEWGGKGTTVSLTQSQPSATVSIVLTKGAGINVRVTDPGGLLAANEGKTPGAHLLVGVGMDNLVFRPAVILSQDGSTRTYRMVVPFDRSVNLSIASAFFQLSDITGKALAKFGNLIPVLAPSGREPPTLVLNLIGSARP